MFKIGIDREPLRLLVADYLVLHLQEGDLAGETTQAFAECAGLLEAVHASEAAFHQLPSHQFPRCRQARRYNDLFYLPDPGEDEDHVKKATFCGDFMRTIECEDCGFEDDTAGMVCRSCDRKSACQCGDSYGRRVCVDCLGD